MGQTLTYGVYLPDEGERNCYSGLAQNWQILDNAVGAIAGKANASHTHGNITNDGAIGSTSGLPVITGTDGVLTTGTFGSTAGTFCEGNDSRLSDARTPVAHTHTTSEITDLLSGDHTWTGSNDYSGRTTITAGSYGIKFYLQNTAMDLSVSGNSGISSTNTQTITWADADWDFYGRIQGLASATASTLKFITSYWTDGSTQRTTDVNLRTTSTDNSFYPGSNASVDLGISTNQWKSVYSQTYFYNGTKWGLDQANEWTNYNRVSGYRLQIKSSAQDIGVIPTGSNQWNGLQFVDKNNDTTFSFQQAFMTSGETRCTITMVNNSKSSDSDVNIEYLRFYNYFDESFVCFGANTRPLTTNTYDLGTSTHKWKTLNGINPGALSLPSTNLINVASSITALDGVTSNKFTPQVDGWLLINGVGVANDGFIYAVQGRIGMTSANNSAITRCAILIPVAAGIEVAVACKLTTLTFANIVTSLGNV